MKIKTSTLTGEKLAYWTARAQGFVKEYCNDEWWWKNNNREIVCSYYRPDIYAGQAMELQKAFKIGTSYNEDTGTWFANALMLTEHEDIEVSICRAVVASKFGEEVEDGD